MAPLTSAQISIDRWSKLLLIGCVILILVSGHALMDCGRHDPHHGAQRSLAGLGLASGMTGVVVAFRPSRCGVALLLIGVLVVLIVNLLHIIRLSQCMDSSRNVPGINACGGFGKKRAGVTATLSIEVVAAFFATCGGCLSRGVVAREQEERVEAEADALRDAILAGAVGSCDLAPLPAYVLAVEGTACVDQADDCRPAQQQRQSSAA